MKIGGITIDGLKYVVIDGCLWKKVLTRGRGGIKWRLCNVRRKDVHNKHYKDPVDMRRWIATYENSENYEIWTKENTLNITHKTRVFKHGRILLDGVHSVRNDTKEREIPITVST